MNMESEVRNGYEISAQMKKVWAVQMDIVSHILEVCKKYDLKIWADGGTLLGLVRDHGYIPWDDDIDLLMLRSDYDKLVSIADKEFTHPFFFQTARSEKYYFRGHAQVRFDGTTAILPFDVFQNFHQGIFVDIFVYDEIPDVEDDMWRSRLKRADYLSDKFWLARYTPWSLFHPLDFIKVLTSRFYFSWCGTRKLFCEYEDLFRQYNGKGYHRIACPCFNRKIFKTATKEKEWYNDTVWLPFEDMMLPAPIGYDNVLSTQYGADYLTPRKAPSIHGGFLVMDAGKNYQEYLKPLRKEVRRNRLNHKMSILMRMLHVSAQ